MCAVLCGEQGLIAKSKCQFKMPEQSQQQANKEDWKGHSPTDPRVRATVPKLLLRILKSDISLRDSGMEKQTDLSLTVAAFKN